MLVVPAVELADSHRAVAAVPYTTAAVIMALVAVAEEHPSLLPAETYFLMQVAVAEEQALLRLHQIVLALVAVLPAVAVAGVLAADMAEAIQVL